MSGPAFGVELPDNLGGEPSEVSTPDVVTEEKVSGAESATETPKDTSLDLDTVQKFRFDGREWTPKEFKTAYMFQQDYSKKTTELSEARKYAENFEADLGKVLKDPALMQEFKNVYPKFYVDLAERNLRRIASESNPGISNPTQTPAKADPNQEKISQIESELGEWRKAQRMAEETKIESWLNNQFSTLETKYPLVNATLQEVVSARAEVLANQGTQITEKVLDKLFKQVNDDVKSHMDKTYKGRVEEQIKAGSKGKDTGPGGGVPGQAPKTAKTIKEAERQMLHDFGVS